MATGNNTEPEDFGIVTPWDDWALEHCGMTAKEMVAKWPEILNASDLPKFRD